MHILHLLKALNRQYFFMKPIVRAISVVALSLPIVAGVSHADPGTPAEQYAGAAQGVRTGERWCTRGRDRPAAHVL